MMRTRTLTSLLCTIPAFACFSIGRVAYAIDTTDTLLGTGAGAQITSATATTAIGYNALNKEQAGTGDTAVGRGALFFSQFTSMNTAVGYQSLYNNTGDYNTALGNQTLQKNTSGTENVGVGDGAGFNNTTGSDNVAVGESALVNNTTGTNNVVVGAWSGLDIGAGTDNTIVGENAGPTSDLTNTGAFGYGAIPTANNSIRIGNSSITSITGHVNFVGDSDARFKKDIRGNVPGIAFVMRLRPVTFQWDTKKLDAFQGAKHLEPSDASSENKRFTGFLERRTG